MADWFGHDLVVEVAFDDDPLAVSPSWTDITTFVRDIPNITRGSQDEFTPPSPGTASFVLDNRTRVFDPSHTGGTYYGKLTPNRRIRVTINGDALFDGYVTGWPMAFQGAGLDSFVTVTAIDLTRRLQNATLQRSAYEAVVLADGPIHYWPLQEQNLSVSVPYVDVAGSLDVSPMSGGHPGLALSSRSLPIHAAMSVPIGASSFVEADITAAPAAGATSNYGSVLQYTGFIPTAAKSVELWSLIRTGNEGTVSVLAASGATTAIRLTVGDDGEISYAYSHLADNLYSSEVGTGVRTPLDLPTHVAASVNGSDMDIFMNGTLVYTGSLLAGTFSIGAAGARVILYTGQSAGSPTASVACAHVGAYPDGVAPDWLNHYIAGVTAFGHPYGERGGDRIERVLDDIGIPDAFRDLDTGDTVHGPYIPARQPALQYLRDVETAEDGMVFVSADGKVTFRGRQWQWVGSAASVLDFADDGTGLPFADITVDSATINTLRNTVSATYRNGDGYLAVSDQASIDAYEEVSEALSIPTVDRASTARGLAGYRLAAWKDPSTRVTQLVVHSRSVPDVWGVELADRVAVKLTPVGVGAPLELEFLVRGVTHQLSPSGAATSTLYLAAAPVTAVDGPYLVVGDPVLGVTGAAAGNRIPF